MVKKMTRAGALIVALEKRGYRPDGNQGKYTVMRKKLANDQWVKAFIGPQGALKIGTMITKARSATYTGAWTELLAEGGYENGNGAGSGEAKSR